jgi:outer membrane immunogenic protein
MKRLALTFAVLCAFSALTFAGPEPMSSKEVVPQAVAENCCFAGWYFGIHGGGILSNFDVSTSADEESLGAGGNGFVSAFDRSHGNDEGSGEGGLHLGYNWCHNGWVFGFEGDLSASGLEENDTAVAEVFLPNNEEIPFSTTVYTRSTVDWYSTARLRVGHTLGSRVYAYLTGGGAFGQAELRQNTAIFAFRDENPSIDINGGFEDNRDLKFGWTAGAGLDFCVSEHITLNFTYLYVDLEDSHARDDISFVSDDIPRSFDTSSRSHSDNAFHVLQGGLSFHF